MITTRGDHAYTSLRGKQAKRRSVAEQQSALHGAGAGVRGLDAAQPNKNTPFCPRHDPRDRVGQDTMVVGGPHYAEDHFCPLITGKHIATVAHRI
jgi:hypothetical protein